MPATAAEPALSPVAEAVLTVALALPEADRRALAERLSEPAPAERRGASDIPPEVLRELEHDADEVAAGRMPHYSWEEVEAELDARLARPLAEQSDRTRAAFAAGRAAAVRAGETPGEWPGGR